jgi:sRNA-binding regulator protein Hfq
MSLRVIEPGWRVAVLLLASAVSVLSTHAEPQNANTLEARVRELHAKSSEVKVTLLDGATLQGRILRVEADSFTIQQKRTGQETAIRYAQAKEVEKSGLSSRAKAILIPTVIGGAALVVLCVAPYPIGILCRKDPS